MFEEEIQEIESKIYDDNADYESILDTLDFILSDDKQNIRALELKYYAAFSAEHYELCINTCNEVLNIDENNIDALIYKANSMFRLERFSECEEISNFILRIYPDNTDAKELRENSKALKALNELDVIDMENIQDEPPEFIQSEYKPVKRTLKQKIFKTTVVALMLIIPLIFIYYLHPIRENMSCNKTYKCRINQTFWGNYNRVRIVTMSNKFYFAKRTSIQPKFDTTFYNSYPIYKLENGKRISPFIYYAYQSNNKTRNITYMNKEYQKFLNYVNAPYRGYYIRSKANPSGINVPFMAYLGYVIILFVLEKLFDFIKAIISSIRIKKNKKTK